MKLKTTKKSVLQNFSAVYQVGYCRLYNLLRELKPVAYIENSTGWRADVYNLGDGIALTTGYTPFGQKIDSEVINEYEFKAKLARCTENKEAATNDLINQFKEEITGKFFN